MLEVPARSAGGGGIVPEAVRRVSRGCPASLVWENQTGGLTFEVQAKRGRYFVKWLPKDPGRHVLAEASRLLWAVGYHRVPNVLDVGQDEQGTWLVTEALPGTSAVHVRWKRDPGRAVRGIGAGLRALHDTLPVTDCPFSWAVEERVGDARRRAEAGVIAPSQWHHEHHRFSLRQALEVVGEPPSIDRLVVCHGDACAPNTVLEHDGRCSGHVDLGSLGIADRWADLAVATWSTWWNYGPGWEVPLLDAYGVDADLERIRYYRLLWDLGP